MKLRVVGEAQQGLPSTGHFKILRLDTRQNPSLKTSSPHPVRRPDTSALQSSQDAVLTHNARPKSRLQVPVRRHHHHLQRPYPLQTSQLTPHLRHQHAPVIVLPELTARRGTHARPPAVPRAEHHHGHVHLQLRDWRLRIHHPRRLAGRVRGRADSGRPCAERCGAACEYEYLGGRDCCWTVGMGLRGYNETKSTASKTASGGKCLAIDCINQS